MSKTFKALAEAFPAIRYAKPLSVGTKVELEGISSSTIQRALRIHTSQRRYQINLKHGTHRFNLDGTPAEEIAPIHKEIARIRLNIMNNDRCMVAKENPTEKYLNRMKARRAKLKMKLNSLIVNLKASKT